MKILDIVHKEQINEYGAVARTLGSLFGTKSSQLLAAIKDGLVSAGKWAGPATRAEAEAVAKRLGPEAERLVAKNPGILDTAVKQANKVRDPGILRKGAGALSSAISGAKTGVGKTNSFVKNLVSIGSGVAIFYSLAEPFIDHAQKMTAALAELEKNPTEEMYQSFLAYRNQELTVLAGRVATVIASGVLAKLPLAVLGKTIGIFSNRAGTWFAEKSKLPNKVLSAMFMTIANSEENVKDIAEFFAGRAADGGPGLIQRFTAPALAALENKILGIFTSTYEEDAAKIAQGTTAGTGQQGQAGKPVTDPKADIGGTSEPAAAQKPGTAPAAAQQTPKIGDKPDPSTLTPSPRDKWEYYAPGLIQDPVTKKIDFAGDRR